MRKNHRFDVMSNRLCFCGKAIKQNLVDRKPNATVCYSCFRDFQKQAGNEISTAREVRTGKRIGRKKGIYHIE